MNQRWLTTLVVFLLGAFTVAYIVTHPLSLFGILLIGAVLGLMLISRPQLLLMAALASGDMGLIIPFFGGLELQLALFAALTVYGIMVSSVRKQTFSMPQSLRFLMGFALVVLVVVLVRGIGFRVLGSQAFGGKDYLRIFLPIGAMWGALKVPMTPKQVKTAALLYALAPIVPFMLQVLVLIQPRVASIFGAFVQLQAQYLFEALGDPMAGASTGLARVHAGSRLASGIWFATWCAFGLRGGSYRKNLYLVLPTVLVLSALSGFRGSFVILTATTGLLLFLTSRNKIAFTLIGMATAVCVYVGLTVVGPSLPLNLQRTLSFLPRIEWDPRVVSSAAASVNWRLELWRYAARHIPDYLWIGRGLLLEDVYTVHAWRPWTYYTTPEFFYATHSYHSGPLSLLLDTGVAGLLLFFLFQVNVVLEGWRWWRRTVTNTHNYFFRAALLLVTIWATVNLIVFYVIYGDLKYMLTNWVIMAILIHLTGRACAAEPVPSAYTAEVKTRSSKHFALQPVPMPAVLSARM
jgi:hypothetical protein